MLSLPICGIMGWVMKMDNGKELPQRKRLRLKNFDYSTPGAYFITICTEDRRQILFRVVGVDILGDPKNVELLPHGIVADKYVKQMNEFYENITVDQYVIMPNHIHFLLFVCEDGSPRTSTPTIFVNILMRRSPSRAADPAIRL